MTYEEKYNQALERASKLRVQNPFDTVGQMVEHIFPELKESYGEKIRKELIEHIKANKGSDFVLFKRFSPDDVIAWLEKQGEQTTDKVEPKFKVGDWIVATGKVVYQIKDIQDTTVTLVRTNEEDESIFGISVLDDAKLWTINDAKDGDVLMTTKARNCPFIYRKTDYNNNLAYYYAGVDGNGDFYEGCIKRKLYHFGSVSNVVPATKEQRDLLFQKMKEAGYEWDGEKKELKKIESKKLDSDKVIEWIRKYWPFSWGNFSFPVDEAIELFKKDFGL